MESHFDTNAELQTKEEALLLSTGQLIYYKDCHVVQSQCL